MTGPQSREDCAGPGSGAPKSAPQIFFGQLVPGSSETGRTATIIIAYDGRLLTGRHSCLFTAPILSASIKATRRCLTDWAEGKARYFSFVSLSRIFEEVLRGTFFSSFGWMFQGLVNGFFWGERDVWEREVVVVSFLLRVYWILNIRKLRKVVKFIFWRKEGSCILN